MQEYKDTGYRDTRIQGYRDSGILGHRYTWIQKYRHSVIPEYRIQGYIGIHSDTGIKRYTVIQGYKDTRNQRYKDTVIHGYKGIRMP